MSADLEIDNYDLQDILDLFRIPMDFNEADLKRAKQMVLKTHPDKSKLAPEYFHFYSKAYKMLHSVWEFRKKGDVDGENKNVDYSKRDFNEKDKKKMLDNFFDANDNFQNKKDFNKWFNSQFDKHKMASELDSKGYGDWLKTDEDMDEPSKNVSMATMGAEFEKKKSKARALVVREEVRDVWETTKMGASELSSDSPGNFDSGMFSSLQFQDLQKAHVNSVIPVTNEDFEKTPQFNNVNEYMSFRNGQDIKPLSEQHAQQYLNNKSKKDDELAVRRAYQLAKETEQAKNKTNEFWSGIKLLHNK